MNFTDSDSLPIRAPVRDQVGPMFATYTRHQYSLADLNHERKLTVKLLELELEVDEATTPLYKLNYMRICLEVAWRSRVLAHGYNSVIITQFN